jgi:hypothetical protein
VTSDRAKSKLKLELQTQHPALSTFLVHSAPSTFFLR